LTPEARAKVAVRVHQSLTSWNPRAVRRVYIPKASNRAKLRPLGIPVIMDRCHQARVRNALEPEWEARFEPRSYGFRPGRGCHDAVESIFNTLSGRHARRLWIVDADLAAAFDRIDHDRLLEVIGDFPARGMIRPAVIRYADDLVACCQSRQQAEQVKAGRAGWLAPRGLAFNEDKTQVVHASRGFDFLGFNVRRYPNGKLLIKPGKKAVRRLRERLAAEMRRLRGSNAMAVIATLAPIVRGWAAYYRSVVSSEVFASTDDYL
jgi:RNA-directed DNA polymerase